MTARDGASADISSLGPPTYPPPTVGVVEVGGRSGASPKGAPLRAVTIIGTQKITNLALTSAWDWRMTPLVTNKTPDLEVVDTRPGANVLALRGMPGRIPPRLPPA